MLMLPNGEARVYMISQSHLSMLCTSWEPISDASPMIKTLNCSYSMVNVSSVLEVNGIMLHVDVGKCKVECVVTPFAM